MLERIKEVTQPLSSSLLFGGPDEEGDDRDAVTLRAEKPMDVLVGEKRKLYVIHLRLCPIQPSQGPRPVTIQTSDYETANVSRIRHVERIQIIPAISKSDKL
jgi:hypothetical protein